MDSFSGGRSRVGSWDNFVYALDADTGDLVWSYETASDVWSSPVLADGIVFVGSLDKHVDALDADAGDLLWR